jgi:hypothetical protein
MAVQRPRTRLLEEDYGTKAVPSLRLESPLVKIPLVSLTATCVPLISQPWLGDDRENCDRAN